MAFGQAEWKTILVGLVLCVLALKIWKIATNPLKHYPGPWYTLVSGKPLDYHSFKGSRTHWIHNLHEKYGSIVRITPREVSVADPAAAQKLYASTSLLKDMSFYEDFQVEKANPSVFNMPDIKDHARRRRIMAPAFARQNLLKLESFVQQKAVSTVRNMLEQTEKEGYCDILNLFRLYTSDVITHATFGCDLRMVESAAEHPFIKDIDLALVIGIVEPLVGSSVLEAMRSFSKHFLSTSNKLRNALGSKKRALTHGKNLLKDYTSKVTLDPDNKEIASRLLMAMNDEPGTKLDIDDVVAECIDTMVAGTDTTSTTLAYLCYEVFTSKTDIVHRLHKEAEELMPDLNSALPALSDIEKLPLLSAVIRETLRVHSAAPSSLPRVVGPDGWALRLPEGEHVLKPGVVVSAQSYTIHRAKVFDDASNWNPQRWLDKSDKAQDQAFRPFSTGHTACLGQNMAYLEAYILAFIIFRNLDGKAKPGFTRKDMEIVTFFLAAPIHHKTLMSFTQAAQRSEQKP